MRLEDLIGREVGRYQVQCLLGRGGMAAVFEAYDSLLERQIALKVLYPQYADDVALVERFRREAVIAARLDHPHIVPIFDVGESAGLSYIAMKLLPGTSLETELLTHDLLDADRAVALLTQIAQALDYAHANQVIHRDIKPGNVMLAPNDHIYLSDFGIARALDAPGLTGTGVIIGTPDYMAPEQIKSQKDVDQRADIYALGVLAYRMVSGSRPFHGSTTEILLAHLDKEPPAASQVNPLLTPAIDAVLKKAMAKTPAERYQTAQAFVYALQAALGEPTAVGAATPPVGALKRVDQKQVIPTVSLPQVADEVPEPLTAQEIADLRAQAARRRQSAQWPLWLGGLLLVACVSWLSTRAVFTARNEGLIIQTVEAATAEARAATDTAMMTAQVAQVLQTQTAKPSSTLLPSASSTTTQESPVATLDQAGGAPTAVAESSTRRPPEATTAPLATARPVAVVPTRPPDPPTTRPTTVPTPIPPTAVSTATPCAGPLQGGFGTLWRSDPAVAQSLGCPETGESSGVASLQYFQGGMMYYWAPANTIYVLYGDASGSWVGYADPGGSDQPQENAPEGFYEPVRGFGTLWRTTSGMRAALGWAITPEYPITGVYQVFPAGQMIYAPALDGIPGRIWVMPFNGSWTRYRDPNS